MKLHGCTVHLVTQAMDEGPILAQAAVPVLPDDTAETLAERVLVQEHRIYPLALRCFAARTDGASPSRGCGAGQSRGALTGLREAGRSGTTQVYLSVR